MLLPQGIEPGPLDSKAAVLTIQLHSHFLYIAPKLGRSIYFVLIPGVQLFVRFQLLHFSSTFQVLDFSTQNGFEDSLKKYQMITYSVYTVGNSATRATYTFLEALHNVFDKKYCSSRYFLRKYYYRLLWKCISFWVWVIFFSCKYRKKIVILTF